jgi:hypothetical protein
MTAVKKKNGAPPAVDKLLKPAIGVAMALLAYQFFKGINGEVSNKSIISFDGLTWITIV